MGMAETLFHDHRLTEQQALSLRRIGQPRRKRVVPSRAHIVGRQRQLSHLFFRDLSTLAIDSPIKPSLNFQPSIRPCASDECKHRIEATQWLARPIDADVTEWPIFYWVPFGTS